MNSLIKSALFGLVIEWPLLYNKVADLSPTSSEMNKAADDTKLDLNIGVSPGFGFVWRNGPNVTTLYNDRQVGWVVVFFRVEKTTWKKWYVLDAKPLCSCWNVGFAGHPVHCERAGWLGATAGAGEMTGWVGEGSISGQQNDFWGNLSWITRSI